MMMIIIIIIMNKNDLIHLVCSLNSVKKLHAAAIRWESECVRVCGGCACVGGCVSVGVSGWVHVCPFTKIHTDILAGSKDCLRVLTWF